MATDHRRWVLDQATRAGQWRIDNPPPDRQYMRLRRHAIRTKVITKNGQPYLRRWYLHDSPRCSLLLHHLCQPDADRWLHDHPWWFVAVVLRGGYTQTRTTRRGQRTVRVRRVNVIRGGTPHRNRGAGHVDPGVDRAASAGVVVPGAVDRSHPGALAVTETCRHCGRLIYLTNGYRGPAWRHEDRFACRPVTFAAPDSAAGRERERQAWERNGGRT